MYKIVFMLVSALYIVTAARLSEVLLGGDRDDYGCITSAGYKWCNETSECVSFNQLCLPLEL